MYKILVCITMLCIFSAKGFSQCNNVDITQGLPTSAAFGSASDTYMEPFQAFDNGDIADQSRWGAPDGGLTHYLGIDLGQGYNICSVYLQMGNTDYATSFKIQGSNNMSAWTDLISLTGNTQSSITVDNLPATGTYRYVRVLLLDRVYSWSYYNIYRFEIFNRVGNDPPTVNLISPSSGASYIVGTNVEIAATAADVNGTISKLEFYNGTTKIGEDITAPYNFSWAGAPVGGYDIYVKAIDNGGAATWTDPVHITVNNPPSSMKNWNLAGNNITNTNSGYVSIGGNPTVAPSDTAIKLAVKGTIYAKKLTVTETLWADYVFDSSYRLRPLKQVEAFIKANNHLPDVIPAAEVKKYGVDVGNNQAILLKKIEELTLYIIDLNKKIEAQHKQIEILRRSRKEK